MDFIKVSFSLSELLFLYENTLQLCVIKRSRCHMCQFGEGVSESGGMERGGGGGIRYLAGDGGRGGGVWPEVIKREISTSC